MAFAGDPFNDDLPLADRFAHLRDRARTLTREQPTGHFSTYAIRALLYGTMQHRSGIDARNTLVEDGYDRIYGFLANHAPECIPNSIFLWGIDDLVVCAQHPPHKALPLIDALAGTANERLAIVTSTCDTFEPSDFHACLTAIAPHAADDKKLASRITDARALMYLEVTRNSGNFWGQLRASWFRREFG
jgi:hypothetical protein